jgi:DNA-binding transcriptional regulator YiaG
MMTAEELRNYVDKLGVPRGQLSTYLGVDYRTMSRWLSGDTPVPRMLELLIEAKAIRVKYISETVVRKKIA